jgi:outer membrane biosynthesis protein TonB
MMADHTARAEPPAATAASPSAPPVVVKKYSNRRLYNTESSSYVTLEDLAGMVRLGRDFVVELPTRVVPTPARAPPPPSVGRREAPPPEVAPSEEPPPPNAVEDLLTRLNERSEAFAELAEQRELEGRPDGDEEGTETEASEGDAYAGRVKSFFQRGWSIPTTMSRDDARGLVATIDVSIGPDLQILSFEIRSSSGNPLFDESVIQQVTRLQAADGRIPPPPEEVADRYIGQTIAVRFSGRQAG